MPIMPTRLQGITTHQVKTRQPKTVVRIFYVRSGHVTEHVGFPSAGRTRTGAAKQLQIEIRFRSVVPLNGKLVSDLLNVGWFQAHRLSILAEDLCAEQSLNQIPSPQIYTDETQIKKGFLRCGFQNSETREDLCQSVAKCFFGLARSPKIAVPTRTKVAPSSMATTKSFVIPIESWGSLRSNSFSIESRSSRSCAKNLRE